MLSLYLFCKDGKNILFGKAFIYLVISTQIDSREEREVDQEINYDTWLERGRKNKERYYAGCMLKQCKPLR